MGGILSRVLAFREVSNCPECVCLRGKYADAALAHADLRGQLRKAVQDGKTELVTALLPTEAAAFMERNAAEAAYQRHQQLAHGGGEAKAESG